MKIDDNAASLLKYYVYLYLDPADGQAFYVGKGKGDRFLSHLNDASDCRKTRKIKEIRDRGEEPEIWFLRYGLTDDQAKLLEAATIDLYSKEQLTNQKYGDHRGSYGLVRRDDLISIKTASGKSRKGSSLKEDTIELISAEGVEVRHKAILITINQLFRSDMDPLELYEATRGIWRIGPHREKADYAMAVFRGIVKEVYKINEWHPAGTLEYKTRDSDGFKDSDRWEFEGEVAQDIRDRYVGFYVGKGNQNPIQYRNVH
jgi:uncharacterized protein